MPSCRNFASNKFWNINPQNRESMKYLIFLLCLLILLLLSSCSLEKRVYITTGGYEPYRQTNVSERHMKALKMSVNSEYRDTLTLWKHGR